MTGVRSWLRGLLARDQPSSSSDEEVMAVANALWSQTGAPLQPEFVDVVARQLHGALHLVDFRGDAESARIRINTWVEESTRKNIRELIARGELHEDTRLVLTNGVYFKGMWELPFYKEATRDEPFYLDSSATVTVPLMHDRRDVRYLESRGYQAIDLPYRGGTLSMLVLLPNKKSGLAALEQTLSSQMLHECVDRMYFREVDVSLPRCRVTWGRTNLRKELEDLGMTLAFNPIRADFSGINGRPMTMRWSSRRSPTRPS